MAMRIGIQNGAEKILPASSDIVLTDPRAGLERMRTRLLDLTSRNRLLNFRHPRASCVRVVDALPDAVFERLLSGQKFALRPVPEPRLHEYGPNRTKPAVDDYARKIGIATSYDLPVAGAGSVARTAHHDQFLQTLLYPDNLDTLARRLCSAARTSIEESGTNMLYLVLGFVEWLENGDVEQPRHAPLITVPVSLSRERTGRGAILNALEYSGEDLAVNLCLAEKLRQDFSLELPEFDADESPERYFQSVERTLALRPGWRLRRWATVCLLYFGKLLMYLDLDPKRWPAGRGVQDHDTVRELFGAKPADPVFADEYDLEDPRIAGDIPPLIFDADSSQHSALIDAVRGRSMVIEGPPGTGKSQTITNLIAACLARGKTVLFVSEKLAALEVVRRRLDDAGLGIFCLELHSHKTQKQRLLGELLERLRAKGKFANPSDLDYKLEQLCRNKGQLLEYVRLMNSAFGASGRTVFEILWSRERRRIELPFQSETIDDVLLEDAGSLTQADLYSRRQILDIYGEHASAISREHKQVKLHPWFGVNNPNLDHFGEAGLVAALAEVKGSALALTHALSGCEPVLAVSSDNSPENLLKTAALGNRLPGVSGNEIGSLLPRLRHPDERAKVLRFAVEVGAFRGEDADLRCSIDDWRLADQSVRRTISEAASLADRTGSADLDLRGVRARIARISELVRLLKLAAPIFLSTLEHLHLLHLDSLRVIPELVTTFHVLRSDTPFDVLPLRTEELREQGAAEAIRSGASEAAQLRAAREPLARQFDLSLNPSAQEIRSRISTLESSGLWQRWFSESYRSARRFFGQLSTESRKASRDEMIAGLTRLAAFLARQEAFSAHPCWHHMTNVRGGIDAPWAEFERLLSWLSMVEQRFLSLGPASEIGRAVRDAPTPLLVGILRLTETDEAGVCSTIAALVPEIASVLDGASDTEGLQARMQNLEDALGKLHSIDSAVSAAGFHEDVCMRDLPLVMVRAGNAQTRERELCHPGWSDVLGECFDGISSDLIAIQATLDLAGQLAEIESGSPLQDYLWDANGLDRLLRLRDTCFTITHLASALTESWTKFESLARLKKARWYATLPAAQQETPSLNGIVDRATRALAARQDLSEWLDYTGSRSGLDRVGVGGLGELVEAGTLQMADLRPAMDYVISNSLAKAVLQAHPTLTRFSGLTHEKIRSEFSRLDDETIGLNRARAANAIDQRLIPSGVRYGPVGQWSELALIIHEIDKRTRHIPIRQLARRAGAALQALKPCFMMGPLSVAQYLAPGEIHFDVVVMDEASQVKPEDAIGAIARGAQVVIVGDPMQLPPTSFFERAIGEQDEEQADLTVAEEGESILDVAASVYQPTRRLRWHYRSRHHSLIAFSNKHFYDNDLIVFPAACSSSANLGVRYRWIQGGVFEARRNSVEAQRVVDAVLEHVEQHPNESLGIATMNFEQCELIDGMLDKALNDNAAAQDYRAKWEKEGEPLFVKNLENVQGDERDVIFVSMTYGRDTKGNFYQRFGPINSAVGHRRLNVLFTRAKRRTIVFSSFDPSWVSLEPTSARGIRALKAYLEYAKTGVIDVDSGTGGGPESDFEVSVGGVLRAQGYAVVPQVGVNGFFIDLAVKHPNREGSYLIGIECDGASYHSARSARDRDRLRQMILENLGWRIYRIWSTDWFRYRQREVERLLGHIRQLLAMDEREDTERGVSSMARSSVSGGTSEETKSAIRRRLMAIREIAIAECPDVGAERRLLRDPMLEVLLQKRPTNRSEWLEFVPYELRNATDLVDVKRYLSKVLDLFAEVA